jgi:hypothetical protein
MITTEGPNFIFYTSTNICNEYVQHFILNPKHCNERGHNNKGVAQHQELCRFHNYSVPLVIWIPDSVLRSEHKPSLPNGTFWNNVLQTKQYFVSGLHNHKEINLYFRQDGGPGSVVGTATAYGLGGPGIESRWGRDFLHLSRPALRPTQPPVQWVPSLSRG